MLLFDFDFLTVAEKLLPYVGYAGLAGKFGFDWLKSRRQDAAQTDKLEAEARKLDIETRKLDAEATAVLISTLRTQLTETYKSLTQANDVISEFKTSVTISTDRMRIMKDYLYRAASVMKDCKTANCRELEKEMRAAVVDYKDNDRKRQNDQPND